MKKSIIFLMSLLMLTLGSLTCAEQPGAYLNGKWKSNIMTAQFDIDAGTYTVDAMGKTSVQKIVILSDDGKTIVFKSDANTIIAEKQSDGSILLQKAGGVPVKMTKVE